MFCESVVRPLLKRQGPIPSDKRRTHQQSLCISVDVSEIFLGPFVLSNLPYMVPEKRLGLK